VGILVIVYFGACETVRVERKAKPRFVEFAHFLATFGNDASIAIPQSPVLDLILRRIRM